jgi:hypothetical protein
MSDDLKCVVVCDCSPKTETIFPVCHGCKLFGSQRSFPGYMDSNVVWLPRINSYGIWVGFWYCLRGSKIEILRHRIFTAVNVSLIDGFIGWGPSVVDLLNMNVGNVWGNKWIYRPERKNLDANISAQASLLRVFGDVGLPSGFDDLALKGLGADHGFIPGFPGEKGQNPSKNSNDPMRCVWAAEYINKSIPPTNERSWWLGLLIFAGILPWLAGVAIITNARHFPPRSMAARGLLGIIVMVFGFGCSVAPFFVG